MTSNKIYRVSFLNQGKVYEVYAREVAQSGMLGFVEVAGLLFGEHTTVVVDPSEERLKDEFAGVERSYIPMHSVIRIDEVEQQGTAKVRDADGSSNVAMFPGSPFSGGRDSKDR